MDIKLPDTYDPSEIARVLSRALTELDEKSNAAKILDEITSGGSNPPKVTERKIHFRRDGTTRELIIRDQGQTFKLTMTKV